MVKRAGGIPRFPGATGFVDINAGLLGGGHARTVAPKLAANSFPYRVRNGNVTQRWACCRLRGWGWGRGQNDGGEAENPKRSEFGKGFGRLLARPLLEGGERCEDECEEGEASRND